MERTIIFLSPKYEFGHEGKTEKTLAHSSTFGILQAEVLAVTDSQKQLHIRMPARLHRALRLRAAAEDKTIQDLVVEVLAKELAANLHDNDDTLAEGDFNDE